MAVTRTARHAASSPREDWMLVLHRGPGTAQVAQRDQMSVLGPGEAVLIDTAVPYRFSFSENLEQVVLKAPYDLLPKTPSLTGLCARPIAADLPALRVLTAAARELVAVTGQIDDPVIGGELAYTLSGLVRTALRSAQGLDLRAAAGRDALLATMKRFVGDRLADPRLDPASIAAAHHVSLRYVTALFQEAGTSPAAYIRDRRLARARSALTDPRWRDVGVAAIGRHCGFTDATTFTLAFKRRYGLRPADLRATAADSGARR